MADRIILLSRNLGLSLALSRAAGDIEVVERRPSEPASWGLRPGDVVVVDPVSTEEVSGAATLCDTAGVPLVVLGDHAVYGPTVERAGGSVVLHGSPIRVPEVVDTIRRLGKAQTALQVEPPPVPPVVSAPTVVDLTKTPQRVEPEPDRPRWHRRGADEPGESPARAVRGRADISEPLASEPLASSTPAQARARARMANLPLATAIPAPADLTPAAPDPAAAEESSATRGPRQGRLRTATRAASSPASALPSPSPRVAAPTPTRRDQARPAPEVLRAPPPAAAPKQARSAPSATAALDAAIDELLSERHVLLSVADVADIVVAETVMAVGAEAGAVMTPSAGVWRVAGSQGISGLEKRLELTEQSWLVQHVLRPDRALVVDGSDAVRQSIASTPVGRYDQLLVVPCAALDLLLILGRSDGTFSVGEVTLVRDLLAEAVPDLQRSFRLRDLADLLAGQRPE